MSATADAIAEPADRSRTRTRGFVLAALLFAPLFLLVWFTTSPAEDAVILYEYSRNLAQHGIVTYGGAGVPIEGATDFLWMVLIAIAKLGGADEFFTALALNLVAAVWLVNVVDDRRYKVAAVAGLLATPFLYASFAGFSAIFFAAAFVLAATLAIANHRRFWLAVLLLCLVRPDGVVWGAGLVLLKWREHRATLRPAQEARAALAGLVVPGLAYFFARAAYFHEWLPLPFLVKSAGQRDWILFYRDSLVAIGDVAGPILVAALAVATTNRGGARRLLGRAALAFFLPVLFYGALRLEQNIGNRFMAPMFFGALYLVGLERSWRGLAAFVVLVALLGRDEARDTIATVASSRTENILHVSRDLARLHGRMLTTEAGRLAYYSRWDVDDSWGLNTPRYAHQVISTAAMAAVPPYDLVVGHCSLALLEEGADLTPTAGRSWANQCKAMVAYMRERHYEIHLLPHVRFDDTQPLERLKLLVRGHAAVRKRCERYDIYALNPAYPDIEALRRVLQDGQGIAYAPGLARGDPYEVCRP